MESIANNGSLARRDIEKVYESLYLRAFTDFENLIEEYFIGMLTKQILPPTHLIVPRVVFKSGQIAREVVYGGRSYVDWFPYDRTLKLADVFYRSGRPFSDFDRSDKHELDKLLKLRNAIAHSSSHAKREFERHVIESTPLMPRERTPAGFLRSQILSLSTSQTRFQNFMIEMAGFANKLCS